MKQIGIMALAKADIISGDGSNFNPTAFAIREQAAKMIYCICH